MAQGALKHSRADIAVAITGIAGPEGGSAQKPVGTVVFAVARRGQDPEATEAETQLFSDARDRAEVRRQAALVALELLLPSDAP
jgi:nicotinamide-nucleotide amidase